MGERERKRERDCVPFYCTDVYARCVFCLLITLCVLLWNISRSTFQMIENTDLYILYTDQNYKHNTFVFAPVFHELNSKI